MPACENATQSIDDFAAYWLSYSKTANRRNSAQRFALWISSEDNMPVYIIGEKCRTAQKEGQEEERVHVKGGRYAVFLERQQGKIIKGEKSPKKRWSVAPHLIK